MPYKKQYSVNSYIFALKHKKKIWMSMIMVNQLVKSYEYPSFLIKTILIYKFLSCYIAKPIIDITVKLICN